MESSPRHYSYCFSIWLVKNCYSELNCYLELLFGLLRIGLLNRIKHLFPLDARVALYNALIRPLFNFADTISGDRDNITLMHDLQVLQNKVAKVILDLPNYILHLPTLSKHSDGLPYFKSPLYIDTLPLLSTSTDL